MDGEAMYIIKIQNTASQGKAKNKTGQPGGREEHSRLGQTAGQEKLQLGGQLLYSRDEVWSSQQHSHFYSHSYSQYLCQLCTLKLPFETGANLA